MDKVIVSLESQFKILILVLLQFSLILKKITVATKLQHDAGNTAVPAKKKINIRKEDTDFANLCYGEDNMFTVCFKGLLTEKYGLNNEPLR